MTITLAVNVSGTLDADDKTAMIQYIVQRNIGRAVQLPFDTNVNIKNSYQTLLGEEVLSTHLTNIDNIVADTNGLTLAGFSDSDRQAIRKALIHKAQSGKSPASLVASISAL